MAPWEKIVNQILKSWEEILKCASQASFDLDWPQPIGSRASGVDTRWNICGNWNYVLKHLRKETWVNKNWTCRIFYLLQNSYILTWKKHIFYLKEVHKYTNPITFVKIIIYAL